MGTGRDKRKKAKEKKDGPLPGKGDAKTERKTQKNEASGLLRDLHWSPSGVSAHAGALCLRDPASSSLGPTRMHATCTLDQQEKKERRTMKKLAGDEDDIDALLSKWASSSSLRR